MAHGKGENVSRSDLNPLHHRGTQRLGKPLGIPPHLSTLTHHRQSNGPSVLIAIVLVNNRRRRAHELPSSKSPIKNPPRTRVLVGVGVGGDGSRSRRGCETEADKALYAVHALFGELAESGC
jgi:hypothetical protein